MIEAGVPGCGWKCWSEATALHGSGPSRSVVLIRVLGVAGAMVWAAAVLARDAGLAPSGPAGGLLGLAPNVGVGLLLPMLVVVLWPVWFSSELTLRRFAAVLASLFLGVLGAEVVHALFLGSGFDEADVVATAVAFGLMAWIHHRTRETVDPSSV